MLPKRLGQQFVSFHSNSVLCWRTESKGRTYTTQAALKKNEQNLLENSKLSDKNLENARPFEEIPGPSKFEFIRAVLPGGKNYKKPFTEMVSNFRNEYGKLIRLPGLFGNPNMYISLNPDDYPIIFRNEGKWPYRRSFNTVKYFREVHRRDFFEGDEGIVAANGEKWGKTRTLVNPILMQPKNSILYLKSMLEVNDEFLKRIREVRDPITQEMPADFEDDINRLTFETICVVALNTQLGLLRKNRDSNDAKIIFTNLKRFMELAFYLEIMPSVWRYIKTPKFYEMMNVLDSLLDGIGKYINEALEKIENSQTNDEGKEKSVLEKLIRINKKTATVLALDMLMAGVDTTSTSVTGILLLLAKNPEKQAKLFQEIIQILPEKDSLLTIEKMHNLPYLRACIKEGLRIYPIIPGTMRKLTEDVVLSGYRVKAGSDISIGSNILVNSEEYVPRVKEYIPERWIRSETNDNNLFGKLDNPFLFLPFGFGPRMCAGKRIVNLEMEIIIARLVRNFNIEFNYPIENAFKEKFIRVPNIPLKFKFEERVN